MTSFDSPIIKAYFTAEEIQEARMMSAQSALTSSAPLVFGLVVNGFEVQLDALTFPGCTNCGCQDFKRNGWCAHVCFGVATMLAHSPRIEDSMWPDTDMALYPDLLEAKSFYALRMLPFTYSSTCQGGLTFTETVVDKAQCCRGEVSDGVIAEQVERLFGEYYNLQAIWHLAPRVKEVFTLASLLRDLGVSRIRILFLMAKHLAFWKKSTGQWWLQDLRQSRC